MLSALIRLAVSVKTSYEENSSESTDDMSQALKAALEVKALFYSASRQLELESLLSKLSSASSDKNISEGSTNTYGDWQAVVEDPKWSEI